MGSPGAAERCQVSCGGSLFTLLQPVMSLQLKSCCKENRCRHGFITQFFKAYHRQFGSLGSCLSEQGLILRSVVPGLLDFQVWLLLLSYWLLSAVTPLTCYTQGKGRFCWIQSRVVEAGEELDSDTEQQQKMNCRVFGAEESSSFGAPYGKSVGQCYACQHLYHSQTMTLW